MSTPNDSTKQAGSAGAAGPRQGDRPPIHGIFPRFYFWLFGERGKPPHKEEESRRLSRRALYVLAAAMVAGGVVILLYALQAKGGSARVSILGVGAMVAGAALMIGGLLGFLFGIPRTLQQQGDEQSQRETTYRANTNLEQISDWLTKILVGVALTQIITMPGALGDLADFMAEGLGGFASSQVFGGSIVLYYLVCGFLFGFLWARLFMGGMLAGADQLLEELSTLREQQEQAQKQEEANLKAQDMARATMERSSRDAPYSQDDLNAAIAAATPMTQVDIFDKARELRRRAWREQQPNAEKLARTLPVFRALALSGPDDIPHRAWGEIGFGLKDMRFAIRAEAADESRPEERRPAPDAWKDRAEWQKACDALSEAIRLRDVYLREKDGPEVGHLYEANRAICHILLDDDYRADQVTQNQAARDAILKDLEYAVDEHHYWMFERDRRNPEWMIEHVITRKWMELNEASLTPRLQAQLKAMRTAAPDPQDC